jgi:hypothetical protein
VDHGVGSGRANHALEPRAQPGESRALGGELAGGALGRQPQADDARHVLGAPAAASLVAAAAEERSERRVVALHQGSGALGPTTLVSRQKQIVGAKRRHIHRPGSRRRLTRPRHLDRVDVQVKELGTPVSLLASITATITVPGARPSSDPSSSTPSAVTGR